MKKVFQENFEGKNSCLIERGSRTGEHSSPDMDTFGGKEALLSGEAVRLGAIAAIMGP